MLIFEEDALNENMSKKKAEREKRAALRRNRKDRQQFDEYDDFLSLNNQLGVLGLSLKQITGDGNCLFRALGDQLEGNPQNHLAHRTAVVNFMRDHREDFEPFMEDNVTFQDHLRDLSEPGVYGGNDSIVAFARLHNLTAVIHQLNKPLWKIHGGRNGLPCDREVHISYHNGDHYNSVRRAGDNIGPARIRVACAEEGREVVNNNCDRYIPSPEPLDSGTESDYENSPSMNKLNSLAEEVERLSGISLKTEIFQALESHAYCVQATVDYLLQAKFEDAAAVARSSLWNAGGTGSRIFGDSVAHSAVTGRNGRQKTDGIQSKLKNKNMSNKRRKEVNRAEKKLANDERRRNERVNDDPATEIVIANVEALTI